MTGVTVPSSMSVVSVMRICFFAGHETVSARAIRCDTSGPLASDANTCPAGCSHRPAAAGADWKTAVRRRILSARQVLLRHRWAPRVLETRTTTSPAVLLYYDGLLRLMRDGGFSYDLIHHALHALGSRALGFTQELFDPSAGTSDEEAAAALESMADQIPHLVAMFMEVAHDDPDSTLGWCDDQTEFEFGLDLILDGLDTMRATA